STTRGGEEHQPQHCRKRTRSPALQCGCAQAAASQYVCRGPYCERQYQEGKREVCSKAILAHFSTPAKSTGYHPPAHCCLNEQEHTDEVNPKGDERRNAAPRCEPGEGDEEHKSCEPGDHPVPELPQVDHLEGVEGHSSVKLEILRNLLVFLEFHQPLRFGYRRKDSGYGLPLGNGQPALCQACGTPNQDDGKNHDCEERQPHSHGPAGTAVGGGIRVRTGNAAACITDGRRAHFGSLMVRSCLDDWS